MAKFKNDEKSEWPAPLFTEKWKARFKIAEWVSSWEDLDLNKAGGEREKAGKVGENQSKELEEAETDPTELARTRWIRRKVNCLSTACDENTSKYRQSWETEFLPLSAESWPIPDSVSDQSQISLFL